MNVERLLCFLLLFLGSHALADENIENLAFSKKWQKLLHYDQLMFGGYKSQADGKDFFLSDRGKTDPVAELRANIEAFKKPYVKEEADKHARCMFPLRFKWLATEFKDLSSLEPVSCPMYDRFHQSMEPVGASLVFSSYYLNNPSSVFGHTFLRLHRKKKEGVQKRPELLDSGINFAANPTTQNPLLYSLFGLIGVFPGTYAKLPYYYKVREYAESESRDLWSFQLNLRQQEVDDLVAHLWELGQTHFDYYFFTENCSYHVLTALEAVNPDWEISSQLPFYVIPSETIKTIFNVPNFVKSVDFRPSARRVFINSFEKLEGRERSAFRKAVSSGDATSGLEGYDSQAKQRILDTAIDYVDYKRAKDLVKEQPEAMNEKRKFLIERAKLGVANESKPIVPAEWEYPHQGHDTRYLGLAAGYAQEREEGFLDLSFRFAFHDRMERLRGYPRDITIELISLKLRSYQEDKTPRLEQANLLKIESLSPIRRFEFPVSWAGHLGAIRVKNQHCQECLAWDAGMAGGVSVDTGVASIMAYTLIDFNLAGSYGFDKTYLRTGVGPRIGFYRQMYGAWSMRADAGMLYHWSFPEPWQWTAEVEARLLLAKNWDVSLQATRFESEKEYKLNTHWYF
ncbi:DUF4105 domain-containing protein [bacterium]|nr:DUF4105 domain-containing protein [bacterium]